MNERAIFIAARQVQNEGERAAYLDTACGSNVELRKEVEALLREEEKLGTFLESPAPALAALGEMPISGAARGGYQLLPASHELGDYRILREIGRGGMGIVYLAEQLSLGRYVALKVLAAHAWLDPQRLKRFQREATAVARLHHTNIVPVYGVGEQDGLHYFVMQFIEGQGLDEVLEQLRKDCPSQAKRLVLLAGLPQGSTRTGSGWAHYQSVAHIGMQVAEALDYAARQGVLHRDIKPANLLLDKAGQVWVMDFGLAKLNDSDDLTHTGDLIGTLRYMAPERFQNRFDAHSDIYSLGLTLYELLTLQPAFEEVDRSRLIARVLQEEPIRPRRLNPEIPHDLETIVLKATVREPEGRYASAGEMAEDLRRFLADRPIQARRSSALEKLWRWCRRNPLVASLTVAIVLLLVALAGGTLIRYAELSQSLRMEQEKRWESLRDRARALRMSRRPGQRLESLRSIMEATRLPPPPGHSLAELRTEAIAALALADVEMTYEWEGGQTPGIASLALDGNLEQYARLAEDGTVTVRRVRDDTVVARWQETTDAPWLPYSQNICFSRDGRYLSVWHAAQKRLVVHRIGAAEQVIWCEGERASDGYCVCFTPDSTKLAYMTDSSRLAVIDLLSKQALSLPPILGQQRRMAFAPDSSSFAILVRRDGAYVIEVRDSASGQLQKCIRPGNRVVPVGWHPDGRTLVTASDEHLIQVWDVPSEKLLKTLEGHKNSGINCSFDSTGEMLLSNDWSDTLRLWETSSGWQLLSFPGGGYSLLKASSDDRVVVTGVDDRAKLQLLRFYKSVVYRSMVLRQKARRSATVHPDGRLLAVEDGRRSVALVDLATMQEIGNLPIDNGGPLLWEDARTLLTQGFSGLLRWPVHPVAGEPEHYRFGPPARLLPNGPVDPWGASPDGKLIALPAYTQGAVLLHRDLPQSLLRLQQQPAKRQGLDDVRHCAVSPNGLWVATGSHENTDGFGAKVWDAATGQLLKALPLARLCEVAFSPDSRWLLTTAGGCKLWEAGTWAAGPSVGGAGGCFSPDGLLLAVEDTAGVIRLVETGTGREVVRLESPEPSRLSPSCFSLDGTLLIAIGRDSQAMHVWDLRALRQELAQLGLDWDAPAYPPAPSSLSFPDRDGKRGAVTSLDVTVDPGELLRQDAQKKALAYNNEAWPLVVKADCSPEEANRAAELAQKALELSPSDGTYWNTLGVAHYRAGHWKSAIEALDKSMGLLKGEWESFNTLFLAMAHWQLGDNDKARQCYEQAVRWMQENKPRLEKYKPQQEELRRLRSEAEALLGKREKKD
ncbi:MAG TPA: protein kinase [Gemmataceae bacterium]|nr:protein kinase [Gemmataceae bacterium]